MGFRVTIIESPPPATPGAPTPAEISAEAAVVDRYLRALHAAHPSSPASAGFGRLERDFVAIASTFSTRLGISYAAWRDVDVAPTTLDAAGIRDVAMSLVSPAYAQRRLGAVPVPTLLRHAKRRIRFRDSRQTSWRSSRKQLPSS
jgi:hypothetical protein